MQVRLRLSHDGAFAASSWHVQRVAVRRVRVRPTPPPPATCSAWRCERLGCCRAVMLLHPEESSKVSL